MSQFLDKFRNDISKLYENADDYNVLIEIGEGSDKRTFEAHSVLLRSRCKYFHTALKPQWIKRDTEKSEMIILQKPNISPKVFEIILKYIYTGNLDLYNKETKDLLGLLEALDELDLEELFEYVQDFFIVHESKCEFDEFVRPYDSILPKVLQSTPSRYTFSKSQLDDVPLSLIPRKPPYHLDSSIIGPKEAALIANWIDPMEGKSVNGRIQYGPAIVLFKTLKNHMENNKEIIGGYNPVGWNIAPKISRIQQDHKNLAIYDGIKFGPSFGKGDLEFSYEDNPKEGFCRQHCYDDSIRSTKDKFLIEEMEVFGTHINIRDHVISPTFTKSDSNGASSSIFEAETSASASSNPIKSYKKHKGKNSQSNRINKSHTSYLFSRDPDDNNIAYCMICKSLDSKNKKPHPYSRKGGTTTNVTTHLREDFHEFVHGCESGFHILCDKTVKKLIYEAYS
ncbi:10742_t:CDS:2 [Cetraspora pellucida]|uniref:10742_t:CDS:1 n=1 Tax=Cetraspora pellucida TaxID=1433469 RepID=A0ACA9JX45_9GLOM|nr:10742_t:CDS:2 [Cetraspora pellucida]